MKEIEEISSADDACTLRNGVTHERAASRSRGRLADVRGA